MLETLEDLSLCLVMLPGEAWIIRLIMPNLKGWKSQATAAVANLRELTRRMFNEPAISLFSKLGGQSFHPKRLWRISARRRSNPWHEVAFCPAYWNPFSKSKGHILRCNFGSGRPGNLNFQTADSFRDKIRGDSFLNQHTVRTRYAQIPTERHRTHLGVQFSHRKVGN